MTHHPANRPPRSPAKPWLLIGLYAVAIIIYAVMLMVTIPHLHGLSGGRQLPDLMPAGLGHAQSIELLSALGEEGRLEFEQGTIAWLEQKTGMIFIRFASGRIAVEAFVRRIVGTISTLARP